MGGQRYWVPGTSKNKVTILSTGKCSGNVKVRIKWSYISTPPQASTACTQASLTLPVPPWYWQQNSRITHREIGQLHHLYRLHMNEWEKDLSSFTKHLRTKMTTFRHLSCHLITVL